jgi:polyisoprenoid-binding protein YceI
MWWRALPEGDSLPAMHKLILLAVVPSLAFASSWSIDSKHATATFSVKHMMLTDVTGSLGRVSGTADLDDKDVTKSKVELTIDVAPDTQEPKRDDHLKSADFFDVQKFPQAKFKSKKVEKNGEGLKVTGDLTLRDVTKEVTLEVTMLPEVQNPFSKTATRGVIASGTLNRLDWGLKWNMPMANNGVVVANEVKLNFVTELIKQAPPTARN